MLLTTQDLCDEYQVTSMTIYRWRKQGMPFVKFGPRGIRFEKEKVQEWLIKK